MNTEINIQKLDTTEIIELMKEDICDGYKEEIQELLEIKKGS